MSINNDEFLLICTILLIMELSTINIYIPNNILNNFIIKCYYS